MKNLHLYGGSHLGNSIGEINIERLIEKVKELKINQIYVLGGDESTKNIFKIA